MRSIQGPDMAKYQEILDACKKEERAYDAMREELLKTHYGKWVVVSDNAVVASGDDPLTVTHEASRKGSKHSYFTRVGFEDKTEFKIRRVSFPYDSSYPVFPIPRASVKVHNTAFGASKDISDLVLDTGADVTCLREQDCDDAHLDEGGAYLNKVQIYGGGEKQAIFFDGIIELDQRRYNALIQMVGNTDERILGRDVLNQLKVTFDGPEKKTTIE